MTSAGQKDGFALVEARHQTVAVELDLIEPFTNSRYLSRQGGELGRQCTWHRCQCANRLGLVCGLPCHGGVYLAFFAEPL